MRFPLALPTITAVDVAYAIERRLHKMWSTSESGYVAAMTYAVAHVGDDSLTGELKQLQQQDEQCVDPDASALVKALLTNSGLPNATGVGAGAGSVKAAE